MKIDWTAVLAVLAALAALLPHLSKLLGDRSATKIAEKRAESELADDLLKKSREMIGDYRQQVTELREQSGRLAAEVLVAKQDRATEAARFQEELDRQEGEISRLQDRVEGLEREVAAYHQYFSDNGLPPLTIARSA